MRSCLSNYKLPLLIIQFVIFVKEVRLVLQRHIRIKTAKFFRALSHKKNFVLFAFMVSKSLTGGKSVLCTDSLSASNTQLHVYQKTFLSIPFKSITKKSFSKKLFIREHPQPIV